MKIRRLDIQGFKSFADRTVLTFGEGITGVVGPNGCGKSNVVDAIRWAMGEQSAKQLRGGGMQDVIFAGSESRGPVGMAEVTITFKNDGALVPPEYARQEEIAVTRRLFRDGTSEYAINKVPCRLRDILDLFMGTGIGKQAYSIIEQGRIGLIVTAKPEDRRAFIEEAAGISRYKARRKQAERRIEATEQNLLRITDITTELKARIGSLERQAKKAERYKRLKGELKELDLHAATHRHLELAALMRFEEQTVLSTREEIGASESGISADEERISAALSELDAREVVLREREEAIHEHQQALALSENNVEFFGRERESLKLRCAEAEAEHAALTAERVTLDAERAAAEELGRELDASGGEERHSLGEQEIALEDLTQTIGTKEAQLEREKQAMVATLTTIAEHNNNLSNLARVATDLDVRLERAKTAQKAAHEKLREHEKEAKETKHMLAENRQLKLALEDRRTAQEQLIERLRIELSENEVVLDAARNELVEKRSRLSSLLEIQRNYEGLKDGVRSIMKKRDEDADWARTMHGIVADVVSAEPRFETAVEAVLGDRLQYVIVSSQQAGMSSIDYLKQAASGRSSFIPLDLREDHVSWAPRRASDRPRGISMHPAAIEMRTEFPIEGRMELSRAPVASYVARAEAAPFSAGPSEGAPSEEPQKIISAPPPPWSAQPVMSERPDHALGSALPVPFMAEELNEEDLWPDLRAGGVCGKLVDLVTAQPGFEHVARVLLGDVVVVEDLAAARKLWSEGGHRKTLVTLAGEVLDPVGVLTGGTGDSVSAGMLTQKREIKELTDAVRVLDAKTRAADERHSTLKQRIGDLEKAIKDLARDGHMEELSIVKLERDLKRLDEAIQRHAEERASHGAEVDQIVEKRTAFDGEVETSRSEILALEAKRTASEALVAEATLEVAALKETARVLSSQVTELKVSVAASTERRESSMRNLSRIVARINDVEARVLKLAEVIAESSADVERIHAQIEQAKVDALALGEKIAAEKVEVGGLREAVEAESKQLREEDQQFRSRRKAIDALKEQLSAAQMRMREYEIARETLIGQIEERYRLALVDVLQEYHLRAPQNEEHAEQIEKLRSQIENIGPINLTAIDEFNEVNERYTFLSAQKEDLEQAIAALRAAIKKINRTSKDRFVDAFRLVNEKFQQVFPRLFNGGTASLVMMDETDPLESGIEMLAQPPGKKLQSVTLLSGGEKALTAVSLIFAIFLIKPTPFCLLDEVDAPLDEANVSRYNDMLRDMCSISQFILITHNKRTMELPDRLYGVTMEEPGISKIVPVDVIDSRKKLKAV